MISVLIPCFNVEKTIERTLDSLLKTSFADFEIVLVDDGSTDGTLERIEAFQRERKVPFLRLLRKSNGGVVSAIAMAVKEAKGDYLLCLDADDYVDPDYLSHLAKEIGFYDVLAFGHKKVTPEGKSLATMTDTPKTYEGDEMKDLLSRLYFDDHSFSAFQHVQIYRWSYLAKADLVRAILPIYERMDLTLYEDLVYTLSVLAKAKSVKIIDYAGLNYVQYPLSHSRGHQDSYEALLLLRKKLRAFLDSYAEENHLDRDIFSTMEFDVSKFFFSRYCLRHDRKESRAFFGKLKADRIYQEEKKKVSLKGESRMRKIYFLLLKYDLFFPIYLYFRHAG